MELSADNEYATDTLTVLREYLLQALPAAESDTHARRQLAAAEVVSLCFADRAQDGFSDTALYASFSRALWSIGDEAEARRILSDRVERGAIQHTLLELLGRIDTSALLWEAVVRGVVRHRTDWISADQRPVWVLDTTRLEPQVWDMELSWQPVVRRLVEELAPLWDTQFGRGALGVVASGRHAQDVHVYLANLIDHLESERNWLLKPQLMRL